MSALQPHENMVIVSIVDRKGNAEKVIEAAQAAGGLFGVITKARANMRQGKKRWLKTFSISPEMESVLILTSARAESDVIHSALHAAGIDRSAIGAVMSMPVSRVWSTEYLGTEHSPVSPHPEEKRKKLQKGLRLITCICQHGKADEIAAAAVDEGAAAPIIHYGEGKGVRDRMGLLKIAVNPEKEVIHVVTDELECERIFDAMVDAGNLYAPGMGFIYTTEIPAGFINLHTTVSTSHTEATMEQIIKAIDDLKENKSWRMTNVGLSSIRRNKWKKMKDLVNLKLVTRRGLGDEFINKAMHSGAHGATRVYANLIGGEKVQSVTGRTINDEREVIDFHVVPESVGPLLKALEEIVAEHESKNSFIMEIPVPEALTYFG